MSLLVLEKERLVVLGSDISKLGLAIKKNGIALFPSLWLWHLCIFEYTFCVIVAFTPTFSVPRMNLACKWTCSPQPPTNPPLLPPPSTSVPFQLLNSGTAAVLVWVMATDAQVTIVYRHSVSDPPSVIGVQRQMSAETEISMWCFEKKAAGPC